jgi:hypothetical protein
MDSDPYASRLSLGASKAATATGEATRAWTRLLELAVHGREPTPDQRIAAKLAVRQTHLVETFQALIDFCPGGVALRAGKLGVAESRTGDR